MRAGLLGRQRSRRVTNTSYLIARFHTTTPGVCQENSIVWIVAADMRERRFTKARIFALRSCAKAAKTGRNRSLCATRSDHTPSLWAAHTPADTNTPIHTLGIRNRHTHTRTQQQQPKLISAALAQCDGTTVDTERWVLAVFLSCSSPWTTWYKLFK